MLQNKKLLIIEDDINLRQSLKIEFRRAGATIYTANDGEAGLRLFNRHQPDLILPFQRADHHPHHDESGF